MRPREAGTVGAQTQRFRTLPACIEGWYPQFYHVVSRTSCDSPQSRVFLQSSNGRGRFGWLDQFLFLPHGRGE
ncbi:hypothetical protein CapIbe_007731 [Capra ibex]